jgi:hypothetical protein
MLRSKLGLLGLCVLAVGMMAFSAASAQAAPEWLVLTKEGVAKTAAELNASLGAELDGETASLDTHLVKLHVRVTCKKGTLENAKLVTGGGVSAGGKVKFEGCETFNAATSTLLPECKVKSPGAAFGTVESFKGKGQLLSSGETELKPETGTEFAKLEFEAGCVLPTPDPVTGKLVVKDCEGKAAEHLVKHLLVQGAGTSLAVGSDTAEHLETSLVGSAWVFLTGEHLNLKWGAMFP